MLSRLTKPANESERLAFLCILSIPHISNTLSVKLTNTSIHQVEPIMDPPAYTATQAAAPTTTQRTIEDTRALIMMNAQMIKPKLPIDGSVTIVIGKTRPPILSSSGARSFTHSASNTTIRISEPAENESRRGSGAAELINVTPQRQQGKHFAALVARGKAQVQQILRGEPQDTIEEALEWLLDRTEMAVAETLDRHGKQMTSGCCMACDRALGALPSGKADRSQLSGWLQND